MTFIVYMNGNRICPKCSGMMARYSEELRFRCLDCGSRFEIAGQPSEKELELAEVETEEERRKQEFFKWADKLIKDIREEGRKRRAAGRREKA